MKVTTAFVQGELIGYTAKIVESTNPSYVSLRGRVVDETRNTLIIRQEKEDKVIIKDVCVFNFSTADGTIVEVDGNLIVGRPEDRVKKQLRKRW